MVRHIETRRSALSCTAIDAYISMEFLCCTFGVACSKTHGICECSKSAEFLREALVVTRPCSSPRCDCGNGAEETVRHYLLHCLQYDRQRAKLRRKVGVGGMQVEKLLGYGEMVKHTMEYVIETRRFDF